MDLFIVRGIVEELQEGIVGGFITKIFQMNRTDLLIRLRRGAEEKQLLISTHPDFPRLYLTEKKYANPQVPPRFCTYLRKHITGARVSAVAQAPYERVIRIALQKKHDAGFNRELVLVAELVGKAGNLLLLEDEKILDCLHFHREEEGAVRSAAPNLDYSPLPSPLRPPLDQATPEPFAEIALAPPGERWRSLLERVSGISPLLAREIEFNGDGSAAALWENFRRLADIYEQGAFEPRIYTLLGGKRVLSPLALSSLGPLAAEPFASMNLAADSYYFDTVLGRVLIEQKQAMTRRLKQSAARLQRRRDNLRADREKMEKELEMKSRGEILVANFPKLRKGMREVEVLDFREEPPRPLLIPLEEALDPAGNVQLYFKRYKKAKRGLEFIAGRSVDTEREIAYLDSILSRVEEAGSAEEVEAIRRELEAERVLKGPAKRSGKERKEPSIPVRRFRSTEGLEIFCGKHNIGNDYLLRNLARGNDLWFHAQGLPGSHVLLKAGPREPKFNSIVEAATIAAYHSSGRGSTSLPVDYTFVKNVHRPKGAPPGLVNIFHQKTIQVKPEKEIVERLSLSPQDQR